MEVPRLLLLCSLISSAGSQAVCHVYAAAGENSTVPLKHQLADTEILKWTLGDSELLVHRKPIVRGGGGGGPSGQRFLKGSKGDIHDNGSLRLTNVTAANAGKYTPLVYRADGTLVKLDSLDVCVIDPVPMPSVTTKCDFTEGVTRPRVLTCSLSKESPDLKFAWLRKDIEQKVHVGKTIGLPSTDVDAYACTVSNQASSKTSAPVASTCHWPKVFAIDGQLLGFSIWIFVGGGGGVVLLLMIVVVVCCVRAKRKRRLQIKDGQELRLRWTEQQQRQEQDQEQPPCPHHHQPPNGSHQQRPAGHTGPRQPRSKQPREHQRPRARAPPTTLPQPHPRSPAKCPEEDNEAAPPLPQPRKNAARIPKETKRDHAVLHKL